MLRGRRAAALALVALLAVSVLAAVPVALAADLPARPPSATAAPSASAPPTSAVDGTAVRERPRSIRALQQDIDADRVFMRVAVEPDGDATWAIEYRMLLSSDNETAAFESLRDDVRQDPAPYLDEFRSGLEGTVAEAENVTGREMTVENLSVRASTQQFGRYGVVTYTFTWTNFARVEGEQVRAGDALAGLFLDSATSLRFEWEEGYTATQVRPPADDEGAGYAVWDGVRSFGSGEPRVVLSPAGATPDGISPMLLGAGVVFAVLVLAGALVGYRRRGSASTGTAAGADAEGSSDGASETAAGGTGSAETDADAGEATAGGGSSAAAAAAAETPDELLSNEERVLKLLHEHGGRIKQQQVVEELDWTAAKTSQVVNGMREDDELEVFRLGRENVLRLPGEGPLDDGDQ